MENMDEPPAFLQHEKALKRILQHLLKHSYYILPHKFYTGEDGLVVPIKVIFWKTDHVNEYFDFGITIHSRGNVEHQMFNVSQPLLVINEPYLYRQLERVTRILARPLRPLSGTLGPFKEEMMEAVGMNKAALGIAECCVCAKETSLKTNKCLHNVCLVCMSKVDRCPMCRNEEIGCACCANVSFESDNEDETDDDFASV